MAFNLKDWYSSKFTKGVEKNAESIRAAANAILESKGKFNIGQESQYSWASTALNRLNDNNVEEAYNWITGAKQSHKAKRVYQKYKEHASEFEKDIQNLQSNIANVSDFSSPDLTAEEKTSLTAKADAMKAELASKSDAASLFGVSTTANLTKTATGDYIPTMDLTSTDAAMATTRQAKQTAAAERQATIERQAGIATNVAGGTQATAENTAVTATTPTAPSTPVGDKLLSPSDFDKYRTQLGVDESNFDQYFTRVKNPQTGVEDIYLKANFADGAKLGGIAPSGAVSAENLGTSASLQDYVNSLGGTSDLNSYVSSLESMWEFFKSSYQTELETTQQSLMEEYKSMTDQLGGESARYEELMDKYGISDTFKQLQEVNLQIAQLSSEYQTVGMTLDDQTIPSGIISGQTEAAKQDIAIKLTTLSAVASALTGNMTVAQNLVDKALEVEFGALEKQIEYTKSYYTMVSDQLSKEESKQWKTIELLMGERERIMGTQKEEKEKNYDLMLTLASNGLDTSTIDLEKSYEENLAIVSPLLSQSAKAALAKKGTGGTSTGKVDEYVSNIQAGILSLSDVPSSLRNQVASALSAVGYDEDYQSTLRELSDYKEANYTREEIEAMYEESGEAIPLDVEKSLNELYGVPEEGGETWWSNTWNSISNWFTTRF